MQLTPASSRQPSLHPVPDLPFPAALPRSLVSSTARGSVVALAQSSLAGTLQLAASYFTSRLRKAGVELQPEQAMAAAQVAAAELLTSPAPWNVSDNGDLTRHLNGTFQQVRHRTAPCRTARPA